MSYMGPSPQPSPEGEGVGREQFLALSRIDTDWLRAQANASPGSPALVAGGEVLDFATLNARVGETCARLAQLGAMEGDVVCTILPNSVDHARIALACARLALVFSPLNARLTVPELAWQLNHLQADFVISESDALARQLRTARVRAVMVSNWSEVIGVHSVSAKRVIERWPTGQPAAILFTSGTTSKPKAAMITRENIFFNAVGSSARLGTLPTDRWLMCLPMFHIGGLVMLFRAVLHGACVQLAPKFESAAINNALDHDGVTLVSLVPTMLHQLLESRQASPPALRAILLGGAAASETLLHRAFEAGYPIATTYGLTEATSQVATSDIVRRDDTVPSSTAAPKFGSVGKPLLFATVRIAAENGGHAPLGVIGEICVRGPMVMAGYFQETTRSLVNGELRTGDMGYLDADGDLFVVQRRSDLIVTGGENVYPAEVEAVLREHAMVLDACVVGLMDPVWGQRVAALIVAKPGGTLDVAELDRWCRERLAGFKMPRRFRFAQVLPLTASGKVARAMVTELLATVP